MSGPSASASAVSSASILPLTEATLRLSNEQMQMPPKASGTAKRRSKRKPLPKQFLGGICLLFVAMIAASHVLGLDQRPVPAASQSAIGSHCDHAASSGRSPKLLVAAATGSLKFLRQAHERKKKIEQASLAALARVERPGGANNTLRSRNVDGAIRALHDGQCIAATPELALRMANAWRALSSQRARMPRPSNGHGWAAHGRRGNSTVAGHPSKKKGGSMGSTAGGHLKVKVSAPHYTAPAKRE